ncbi:unnamed protein product [Tuber aestivum]|uniref:Uncharacterized protein n=1 Tax=Tuber aestivum TaxID=59557 RepID=A0A292PSB3_9PEZI|nr:unnamed protein product [Tuber aestivum]
MDSQRPHTPLSWATRPTSPRPIPSASPRLAPIGSAVHSEWQKLRIHAGLPQDCRNRFGHLPRNFSRPHTPVSLSPSPSPSQCSYYTDHCDDADDFEIEEIEDEDEDSGVELLVGEYEEPSPDYGRPMYDSDEDDEAQREIVYSFGMLSACRGSSPIARAMAQQQLKFGAQPRKAKRSYTESVGSSDSDYDSGLDSQDSGRRTRRRVIGQRDASVCATSFGTSYAGSQTSDYEVDMEL